MALGVDFLRLYREFHLEPGADIDDLKRAYRRRVALVHPDRLIAKDAISQHLATEQLQTLTRLYEAGVRFHRQHGRLPGALPVTRSDWNVPAPPPALGDAPVRRGRRWITASVLAGGICIWALSALWPEDEPVLPSAKQRIAVAGWSSSSVRASMNGDGLRIGMPQRAVLEVIGAPVARESERWLYGPSWIRFEDGRVAEWYSSPLHPFRLSRDPAPWTDD